MNTNNFSFVKNGENHTGKGDFFTREDLQKINNLYFSWKSLNKSITDLNCRRSNLPEAISEVLPCIIWGYARCNNKASTTLDSNSFDCIDITNGKTIQVKGVSTSTFDDVGGPTSFGPRSEYDIILLEHVVENENKVYFYILDENFDLENVKVNKNETFGDQCKVGKRPRFSLLKKVREMGVEPIYVHDFSEEV